MAAMFSDNAKALIKFLQANPEGQFTADDLAEALGLTTRQINGTATGTQKKGITERIEVEGFDKKVIRLTPAGLTVDTEMEKPEA
jgi:prophage antirepressor-like protein